MSWQTDLLAALQAPADTTSVTALTYWAASEGTPPSWNNWLATTLSGYGGVDVNSSGVKAYPTEADGVAATAATLSFGAYAGVVAAFRNRGTAADIWSAVNASPWCAGCQNGKYPVALYDYLGGNVGTGGGPPPAEPTLREGDTGPAVKTLQARLIKVGYKIAQDGDFGPATLAAVKSFQRTHQLTVDGIVGPKTWGALDAAAAGTPAPGGGGGGGGPAPPNQAPAGVPGTVGAAWSNLGERTGRGAVAQLRSMQAAAAQLKGARR